jgi:hypothetical protein
MARATCSATFDGTPVVWAARYLRMNGKRRLVGSLTHGSMANALPKAVGAQMIPSFLAPPCGPGTRASQSQFNALSFLIHQRRL